MQPRLRSACLSMPPTLHASTAHFTVSSFARLSRAPRGRVAQGLLRQAAVRVRHGAGAAVQLQLVRVSSLNLRSYCPCSFPSACGRCELSLCRVLSRAAVAVVSALGFCALALACGLLPHSSPTTPFTRGLPAVWRRGVFFYQKMSYFDVISQELQLRDAQ